MSTPDATGSVPSDAPTETTEAPATAGTVPPDVSRLVRGTKSQAMWLATFGFFGGFAGVSIFGPLVPKFTDLLGLSPFAAGILAAIPALTGSLLRIPFGAAVDKMGGKRPFLTLLAVTNVGVLGLLLLLATRYPDDMAGTYPVLLLLGALIGCGIATFSVGIAQVSYWFPHKEQGGALGTYAGLGNTSPGLSTFFLPLAVGALGMLGAYSIWFGILLVITIGYGLLIKDAPWFQLKAHGIDLPAEQLPELGGGERRPSGSAVLGLRQAATIPATWVLVFFYFLSFGGFLAFTSWLPTYWHGMYGSTLREAGLLTATFSLISALIRVPGGLLSDRISIRYALHGNFLLMLAGVLVLSFSQTFSVSLIATIGIAVGMGLQNAIVFKLLPHYVPHAVGGASGWIGGLGALGGFVLPPVIGAVTGVVGGATGYARGFLPVAVLLVVALPVVTWLQRWTARQEQPAA
jgi:NNP family nitrate/nitrite transporter-like MFS transporter